MTKPFIVTGLDGLIVDSGIFSKAHEAWFDHFSAVLGDESFKELMHKPNYWDAVYEIMEKQLGLSREIPEEANMLRKFARETYRSLVLRFAEQHRKEGNLLQGVHKGTIEVFKSLKDKSTFTLLTTLPKDTVSLLLKKIDCKDLYVPILTGDISESPSAKEIYERYQSLLYIDTKPACYIGSSKRTIEYFNEMGVPTIFPAWTMSAEDHRETREASRIAYHSVVAACSLRLFLENRILKSSQ